MDYVTRQFINLVKHFRKDLRKALSDLTNALHKQTEAIRKAYQITDDKQGPSPEVTVLNNLPSSIEVHQNEHGTKAEKNYRLAMFGVTTLTLGAIVVYAVLVFWQYQQMIQTNAATQLTFREIQKQTKLARQQLVGSQGAVLDLSVAENDMPGEFTVQLINSVGRMTATEIHLRVDASQQRLKDGFLIGVPFHFEPPVPPIAAGKSFVHVWHMPWSLTDYERQQGGQWVPDWPGKRTFVFRAEVTYQDGFLDEVPVQQICKQWLPGFTIRDRGQQFGGTSVHDCADIPSFIRASLEQEKQVERDNAK